MGASRLGLTALAILLVTAGPCPRAGAADADDLARCEPGTAERLRFIEDRLETRRPYATWWWGGWTATYGVGMVVESVRAGLEDDSDAKQADLGISAVKALGGTVRLLVAPPTARLGAGPMRAVAATDEPACRERLAVGEDLLRKNAAESGSRWSWKRHASNFAVNAAGALIVGFGFGDQQRGWRSAGYGFGVGEGMILSHPWQGEDDLAEYQQRFDGAPAPRTSLSIVPWRGGARLVLGF